MPNEVTARRAVLPRAEADLEVSQARVKQLEDEKAVLRAELAIVREDYGRLINSMTAVRRESSPDVGNKIGRAMIAALPEKPHAERVREKLLEG